MADFDTMTNAAASSPGDELVSAEAARWAAAANYLQPDKSLDRLANNSKYVIATATIVATTLAAVGTITVGQLNRSPTGRVFALIAVILGAVAVLVAYLPLILRSKRLHVGNLAEVKSWFENELRRSRFVRAGGILLVGALTSALTAVFFVVALPTVPTLSVGLTEAVSLDKRTLSVSVIVENPREGEPLSLTVTGKQGDHEVALVQSAFSDLLDSPTKLEKIVEVPAESGCFAANVSYSGKVISQSVRCPSDSG